MRIVFSRKGFDSAAGGGSSPIVDGVPVSLPIPAKPGLPGPSYADLGLADHVEQASRGRYNGTSRAHHDPMFTPDGRCLFGQCDAAQRHLENQGVGLGDLFLFFGRFQAPGEKPHHRLFGWLWVDLVVRRGDPAMAGLAALDHPHALAPHGRGDAVWCGPGGTARQAHAALRLSVEGGPMSLWRVPGWLERCGLSCHEKPWRWRGDGLLHSVARGQEFVAHVGDDEDAHAWAHRVLALMA